MQNYQRSLIDPFSTVIPQPRLHDGRFVKSLGVKFRNTGQINCKLDGTCTYIQLFPGHSNVFSYNLGTGTDESTAGSVWSNFHDSTTHRADIHNIRCVSSGLKLSLENSPDENEGYWEAIRCPDHAFSTTTQLNATTHAWSGWSRDKLDTLVTDMANDGSYQTGKLRDLHRYLFKLNYLNPIQSDTTHAASKTPSMDMIIIRVWGRVHASVPSVLRFEVVGNYVVDYRNGTMLNRMETPKVAIPNHEMVLQKANYQKCAVLIS
jgi:hypothetical protein